MSEEKSSQASERSMKRPRHKIWHGKMGMNSFRPNKKNLRSIRRKIKQQDNVVRYWSYTLAESKAAARKDRFFGKRSIY